MKTVLLTLASTALALALSFAGFTAYQDHKVVTKLAVLATEIGEANGQKVTAIDVVAVLVDERIKLIQQRQAEAKAPAPTPTPGK